MLILRALLAAWLLPAVALMWIGLATTGLRPVDAVDLGLALGRTQAAAVLLAVFTVLVGASAFVRRPQLVVPDDDIVIRPDWSWLGAHLAAFGVAMVLVVVGNGVESVANLVWPVAALFGFGAGLALPRALIGLPCPWAPPLAALATGMAFQLTVGWLHIVHPGAMASPALIVEGLILAWAATSACRVDLSTRSADALAVQPVITPGADVGVAPGFSPTSAPPSFAEPMVGH